MAFEAPAQPAYIFDRDVNHSLLFDGIIKIQHNMQVKIEDDQKNVKKEMVNNAKVEPNEVTFEVVMSDVYTTSGDLTGSSGSRLVNAYTALEELKNSRRKVDVITELMTYKNMLLKSIVTTQDETSTDSWHATVTFHEILAGDKNPTSQTSTPVDLGTQEGFTPTLLFQMFGQVW